MLVSFDENVQQQPRPELTAKAAATHSIPPPSPGLRQRLLRVSEWSLSVALASLLTVDILNPMAGLFTLVVLSILTFLVWPWGWLMLRPRSSANSPSPSITAWVLRVSFVGFALVLLGAKWWLVLLAPAAQGVDYVGSSRGYAIALVVLFGLGTLRNGQLLARLSGLVVDHPARLIVLSFGFTGVFGGFALSLPLSLHEVHRLSMLDNLFMAFSAVCVTGLSVNVIAHTYTWAGQLILCLLIQIGGLGIMVLSAAIAVVTGQRMRIRRSAVLAEIVDAESVAHLRRLVIAIVSSTLLIEALAALLLYLQFSSDLVFFAKSAGAIAAYGPWWAAIFHSVSAFCNAGFSTFEAGLEPFRGQPGVLGVVVLLIVAGGIGFPVLYELAARLAQTLRARRRERMSLHSRIAIRATALLLGLVAVAYLLLEWHGALAGLGWPDRIMAALFQSASCRTAGFNVVDVGQFGPPALMLTCVAMFIGACPGSTGGGVKTTTVAALFAGLRSELESRPAYLLDRALTPATISKAIGVSFLSLGMLAIATFLLLLCEQQQPLDLIFEVFSAFSTTGLSTGVTPRLSSTGKVIILLTMYVGRIGPLTLALAIARKSEPVRLELPAERVLIG